MFISNTKLQKYLKWFVILKMQVKANTYLTVSKMYADNLKEKVEVESL